VLHHDGRGAASQFELAAEEAGLFTRKKFFQPARGTEWKLQ